MFIMKTGAKELISGYESFVIYPCVSVVKLNDCTDNILTKRPISKTGLVIYFKSSF